MFSAQDDVFSADQATAWQEHRHAELCEEHGDHDDRGSDHDDRGRQPTVLHGKGFLYRPRQLLMDITDAVATDFVMAELIRLDGVPNEQSDASFAAVDLPVRAWLMPAHVNLPALVTELRRAGHGRPGPNVSVNHVLSGEPDYHGGPAGEPRSAQPFSEGRYASGTNVAPSVAVLDTGYDPAVHQLHPGLSWRLEYDATDVENAVLPSGYLAPEGAHGTFIDGIFMRLAPQARIRQVKVLDPAGVGDDQTIALELAKAARAGIQVINLSLGGYTQDDVPPPATSAAIARLAGTVVVAAAGNNTNDRKFYPAALDGVIAVGALDTRDPDQPPSRATFSNYGPWVDVYAPGVGILSTYLDATWKLPQDPAPRPIDGYAYWSGTSFAAPQIAAMIASAIPQAGTASQAAAQVLAQVQDDPQLGPILIPDPGVVGLSAVAEADQGGGRAAALAADDGQRLRRRTAAADQLMPPVRERPADLIRQRQQRSDHGAGPDRQQRRGQPGHLVTRPDR
jgi:hypothetical protein